MIIFYVFIISTILIIGCSIKPTKEEKILDKNSTTFARGIVILFIVFHHIVQHTNITNSMLNYLSLIGYLCVGVFLFLSGYGNYLSYKNNEGNAERWILKRILRVYIEFWSIWIIDLAVVYFINGDSYGIASILNQGLSMTLPYWINWYLKIQVLVYILFYISFKLFKNRNSEILLIMTILFCGLMILLKYDSYWWNTIICFGVGNLFAKYKNLIVSGLQKINKWIALTSSILVFAIAFIIGCKINYFTVISSVVFCITITVILYYYEFQSKIINFIGNISLEIYLWHLVLLKLLFRNKEAIINANINLLLFMGLSVLLAYITNKLITKII